MYGIPRNISFITGSLQVEVRKERDVCHCQ